MSEYTAPQRIYFDDREGFKKDLADIFGKEGISVSEDTAEHYLNYAELLVTWNTVMNLTGITEPRDIIIKHFLDSVLPFKELDMSGKKVIDVGSGAGFPALPLKILFPDIHITMLDSTLKRINFLKTVCALLRLSGTDFICARAEEGALKAPYRDSFDIACARAVAPLNILCEYCLPYVKTGGLFIALKGKSEESAANAIKTLGGALCGEQRLCLPEDAGERSVITVKKISETPKGYPRNGGRIAKKPL